MNIVLSMSLDKDLALPAGNHAVSDQLPPIGGNHFASVAEDPDGLFVGPIMNDVAGTLAAGARLAGAWKDDY